MYTCIGSVESQKVSSEGYLRKTLQRPWRNVVQVAQGAYSSLNFHLYTNVQKFVKPQYCNGAVGDCQSSATVSRS